MFNEIYFRNFWLIYFIIPIFFLLLFIINNNFVKIDEHKHKRKIVKIGRFLLLWSRTIVILLILISMAYPFTYFEERKEGDPKIALLVDNSTSMKIFDLSFISEMKSQLNEKVPTSIREIGFKNMSSISEGIYGNLDSGNLVLVTDGNNYKNKNLIETLLLAISHNVSITFIDLEPVNPEISVKIEGPSKIVEDVENEFEIKINKVLTESVLLNVKINGIDEINKRTNENSIIIKKSFKKGQHQIVASINGEDTINENNVYYKSIEVIEKPKILLLSKERSPLSVMLNQLYDVDTRVNLPKNINHYLSIIIDDLSINKLTKKDIDKLREFVNLGDGLIFVGGENSFDKGDYKGSYIETLLPVHIGKAEELQKTEVNIILLIDISGSTSLRDSLEKEITLDIIDKMDEEHSVAIITFNHRSELLKDFTSLKQKEIIKNEIKEIKNFGNTNMKPAIEMAINMLEKKEGSKNIIVVGDGKDNNIASAIGIIRDASKKGIVTHAVDIGETSNKFNMNLIAESGNGDFFSPDHKEKIEFIFEKPENKYPTMIIPKNHFIVNGLKSRSYITGFNKISAKSTGIDLASTVYGHPLLIVGRYGLGRIAVLGIDNGNYWSGNLYLNEPKLISRIMNWAIENPERKNEFYIEVKDSRIGEKNIVYVKSLKEPEDYQFSKIDHNLYKTIIEDSEVGFHHFLEKEYAINYHPEIEKIGINQEIMGFLNSYGIKTYRQDEINTITQLAIQSSIEIQRETKTLRHYFLIPALIIIVLEMVLRRIFRYKKIYK